MVSGLVGPMGRWGQDDPAAVRARRLVGALVGLCCGVLALGPALRPGYLLFYDLVFVPRLALSDRTLGVVGSVPRSVPNDLVVALASHVAPGWLVQKVLLLLVFVGVGAGMGGLMSSRLGAGTAALAAAWNPYVAERMAIGHWGFLLGYAALPFLVGAAGACRHAEAGDRGGQVRLGWWTLLTALTGSTGAVLGLLVTLAVLLVPGQERRSARHVAYAVGVFLLANAAWWFPFLTLAPSGSADTAGVQAFGARADTPWGVLGSLLTGGAIWNPAAWTPGRTSPVTSGAALLIVLLAVGVAGWTRAWRRGPEYAGLGVAGLVGLLLAVVSSVPGGRSVVAHVVTGVPGGGLLRDSQKFVALWVLVVAVAAGLLAERIRDVGRDAGATRVSAVGVAAVAGLWPVVALTGLAWGQAGAWHAVQYPASYDRTVSTIDRLPAGGVAVFPWTLYRRYAFDRDAVVLDPWERLLDRAVLVNDDLPLSSRVVRGESGPARRVGDALRDRRDPRAALWAAGVRYVLVETDQPSDSTSVAPAVLRTQLVARHGDLALYDLGASAGASSRDVAGWRYLGLGALALAPLLLVAQSIRATRGSRRSGPAGPDPHHPR